MPSAVIGIDLGTTYSCVGVIKDGKVQIVANHNSKRVTPSVVAFDDGADDADYEILIGEDAKEQSKIIPEATIFCVKRLMGRPFSDPTLKDDLRMWPFRVIDENGKAKYQVDVKDKTFTFFPEEISARILGRMKSMAEDFLQEDVEGAVITVPAYFNENQKIATRAAAEVAGLKVLELLSEPTAAAIAYGVDLQEQATRTVLVFDFGGGTFDVSVIQISERDKLTVLSIDGDPHLGGEDIDNNLALYFEDIFNKKHNTQLRADNSRAWRRLKDTCERLKIQLSKLMLSNLKLDRIHEGKDLNASLTRAKLEEINDNLFRRAISITEKAILKSKLQKEQINDILLVGGSTRIPKIKKLLQQLLPKANMPDTLDADEAVAVGATILAAEKTDSELERDTHIKLWNVLPQSLGIGTGRGLMHTFIECNTCVPVTETLLLSTEKDNQNLVRFKVFEGESKDTSRNYYLGEFRIAGIPPAPRGVPQIEVTFSVNEDCMLEVTAQDLATTRTKALKIQYDHERLSNEELQELKANYQKNAKYDKEVRTRIDALKEIENLAKAIRTSCLKDNLRSKVPASITNLINEIYKWIDECHHKQEYPTVQSTKSKESELKKLWDPFITGFNKMNTKAQPPVLLDA